MDVARKVNEHAIGQGALMRTETKVIEDYGQMRFDHMHCRMSHDERARN